MHFIVEIRKELALQHKRWIDNNTGIKQKSKANKLTKTQQLQAIQQEFKDDEILPYLFKCVMANK